MDIRRDVFQAIADPTRRSIISLLSKQPMNAGTIAVEFEMSRSAISQHIKILQECGLVVIHQQGRERYCTLQFDKLREVTSWVEQHQVFWESKLDALEHFLGNDAEPPIENF
jgi:DNA-binding transcriptional ArsR family regulator